MSKYNKNKQRGSNLTINQDLTCLILRKKMGWKYIPMIREWMKSSQKEIKEANNPIITNEEIQALIR